MVHPLVNVHSMGNFHFQRANQLFLWSFFIFMLVYQVTVQKCSKWWLKQWGFKQQGWWFPGNSKLCRSLGEVSGMVVQRWRALNCFCKDSYGPEKQQHAVLLSFLWWVEPVPQFPPYPNEERVGVYKKKLHHGTGIRNLHWDPQLSTTAYIYWLVVWNMTFIFPYKSWE